MYIFLTTLLISLLATLSSVILGKGLMYLMAYIYISNKQRRKNNE